MLIGLGFLCVHFLVKATIILILQEAWGQKNPGYRSGLRGVGKAEWASTHTTGLQCSVMFSSQSILSPRPKDVDSLSYEIVKATPRVSSAYTV